MLLAGEYALRSALETLSSADIRGVVVLMPLLEGRSVVEGLDADAGLNPSDAGLLVLSPTCNPPSPLGLPEGLGAGAMPPGCGLCPPGPGLCGGYTG